jgi:hypothetical protein
LDRRLAGSQSRYGPYEEKGISEGTVEEKYGLKRLEKTA